MSKKVWEIALLDPMSVQRCIDDLTAYRNLIDRKCETLRRRVAELIRDTAQKGFNGSIVDDLTETTEERTGKGPRKASVSVTWSRDGDNTLVIANGEDAVWVEFGAGVTHNGAVGSSPNPLSAENGLGFAIGTFGTNGSKDKWAFTENGQTLWSYGTPADMPLYNAILDAIPQISDIAREVFEQT